MNRNTRILKLWYTQVRFFEISNDSLSEKSLIIISPIKLIFIEIFPGPFGWGTKQKWGRDCPLHALMVTKALLIFINGVREQKTSYRVQYYSEE